MPGTALGLGVQADREAARGLRLLPECALMTVQGAGPGSWECQGFLQLPGIGLAVFRDPKVIISHPSCRAKADIPSVREPKAAFSGAPPEGMRGGNIWSPNQHGGSCYRQCGKIAPRPAAGPLCTILIVGPWGLRGSEAREGRTAVVAITPCSRHVLLCHGPTDGPHFALPLKRPASL